MSDSKTSGISFMGLLGIVFIILKLCNVIDWSWWWVLLPIYGGIAIFFFILFIILIIGIIASFFK